MKFDIIPQDLYSRATKASNGNMTACIAYNYVDEDGDTIGSVTRVEYMGDDGEKKKTFIQADYNKQYKKFKMTADNIKTCLFNRDKIKDADYIVWCEGEKAAMALQGVLPKGWAATTGTGGVNNQKNVNVSPLFGKKVIVWPDNDKVGIHGAMKLSTMLSEKSIEVLGWVKIGDDWEEKDDAYDIVERKGGAYVRKILKDLGEVKKPDINLPEIMPRDALPFKVLGISIENDVFIYCFQDSMIRSIKQSQFNELALVTIYNDMAFWYDFCGRSPRSDKPNILSGWSRIWGLAYPLGIFKPQATRFAGIYRDGEEFVAHLGDSLYIDGKQYDLDQRIDDGIYVADTKANIDIKSEELSITEANNLIKYFELFRTRHRDHRQVLLGWSVASLLAPILPRRPHLWIYSPANTGKSFIAQKMSKISGTFGVSIDSSSATFAGVKQLIQGRGCPVYWDEAEAQSRSQSDKWDRIMEMVRITFDNRDAAVPQGTKEQVAKLFFPRMMFCFSSIRMADFEESLASRIISIPLSKPQTHEEMLRHHSECRAVESEIDWDSLSSRIFMRVYNNADTFFKNYDKAYNKFLEIGTDDRRSSALAVCFAGFSMLLKRTPLTNEDIDKYLWKDPYKLMPEEQSDAEYLRTLIMSTPVRLRTNDGDTVSLMFKDVIKVVNNGGFSVRGVNTSVAVHEYKTMGLEYNKDNGKVYVWTGSPRLERCLGGFKGIKSVAPSLEGFERGKNNGFLFDIRKEIFYNE